MQGPRLEMNYTAREEPWKDLRTASSPAQVFPNQTRTYAKKIRSSARVNLGPNFVTHGVDSRNLNSGSCTFPGGEAPPSNSCYEGHPIR